MSQALRALLQRPEFPEEQSWTRVQYPAQTVIVRDGDPTTHVYLILDGTVRVVGTVALADNRAVRPGYCDLTTNETFGELCMFESGTRSGTVEAVSDCEIAVIPAATLRAYMDAHPETGYQILRDILTMVASRLRRANERVASLLAWGLKAHGIDSHL
jgi:CRP-like cAMP-binding protein